MNEVTFVDLLDRTDAYIRANEALVSAIRSAFFASAQARYATGYRQEPLIVDTASSLRVVADKSNHAREWYFKDQNEHSAISSTSEGAKDDSTSQAITPPAEEAVPLHANRKEDGELDSKPPLKANAFPSTSYSSLISEIAGKYGCADPHEQHWSESDDGFESPGESSRKFLPPQWQSVRASFRSALNAALRTAEARTALQLHIESLQAVEKD